MNTTMSKTGIADLRRHDARSGIGSTPRTISRANIGEFQKSAKFWTACNRAVAATGSSYPPRVHKFWIEHAADRIILLGSISSSSLIDSRLDPYPAGRGPSVVSVQSLNQRGIARWRRSGAVLLKQRQKEPSGLFPLWRFFCVRGEPRRRTPINSKVGWPNSSGSISVNLAALKLLLIGSGRPKVVSPQLAAEDSKPDRAARQRQPFPCWAASSTRLD